MGAESRRKTQLRWLFNNLPGADGRSATSERAVEWLARNGGPTISADHLTNIRSGLRGTTHELLIGLAAYFEIPSAFWDDLEVEEAVRTDVAKIDSLAASWRTDLIRELSALDTDRLRHIERKLERLRDEA